MDEIGLFVMTGFRALINKKILPTLESDLLFKPAAKGLGIVDPTAPPKPPTKLFPVTWVDINFALLKVSLCLLLPTPNNLNKY